jgi:leucyl aminopeptidase
VTTYALRKGAAEKSRTDAVVIGIVRTGNGPEAAPGGAGVAGAYGRRFAALLSSLGFTGARNELARVPAAGVLRAPLLVLVGLGDADGVTPPVVREAAGAAARSLSEAGSVTLALPAPDATHVRAVAEGFLLGGYRFDTYKTTKPGAAPEDVVILSEVAKQKAAAEALATAQVVASATMLARDWVNTPPGDLTPPLFADAVVAAARPRKDVKAEVLDEQQLVAGGYGGIVSVGQGSSSPPRLVTLRYSPRGAHATLTLVGKGITYDSGGLSIKPSAAMRTMKSDMGGAAAVVAATFAIAELGLPIRVTTLVPMAENMVSGSSTRPGDVVTTYGGKTVEVLNTDAEGRMVLADALALALEGTPDVLVDVATLTGACEMALGDRVGGLFGTEAELVDRTLAAADRAGERFWQLPLLPEMTKKVQTYSKVADLMQHNVDLYGGALYAAAFLREFVGDRPWLHFDIAGTAFNEKGPYGHVPSGGTGSTVPTLVELAADLSR